MMTPDGGTKMEASEVLGVNSHESILQVHIRAKDLNESLDKWNQILNQNEIPMPQILHCRSEGGQVSFWVTGPNEICEGLLEVKSPDWKIDDVHLSSVSATCAGATGPEMSAQLAKKLREHKIEIKEMIVSPMTISFFVTKAQRTSAIKALHELVRG